MLFGRDAGEALDQPQEPLSRLNFVGFLLLPWVSLALLALAIAPAWPGIFTVDSQAILRSATSGTTSDWYSPIIGMLWGVASSLGMPFQIVLIASAATLLFGTWHLFRIFLGTRLASIFTAAVWLWPPVFGLLPWVGRDVWFAAILILWICALANVTHAPRAGVSIAGIALAVLALFAYDARQNAAPLLVISAGVIFWQRLPAGARQARKALVILCSICTGVGIILATELVHDALGVREQHPEQTLQVADLVGMSIIAGEVLLPPDLYPSQDLAILEENRLTPLRLESAGALGANPFYAGPERVAATRAAWLNAIRQHPTAYIGHRLGFHLAQLGLGSPPNAAYFIESDLVNWDRSSEFQQIFPQLNQYRVEYLRMSGDPRSPSILFWPLWYLLAGLAASALLTRDSRTRTFGASLVALQLGMQLVLAVSAPVIEYRFHYYQIVIGFILILLVSAYYLMNSYNCAQRIHTPVELHCFDPSAADRPHPCSVDAADGRQPVTGRLRHRLDP